MLRGCVAIRKPSKIQKDAGARLESDCQRPKLGCKSEHTFERVM